MSRQTYLYLCEVFTFGASHPIKVGISSDLRRRKTELRQRGLCISMRGYFLFDSRAEAQRVEVEAHHNFPTCPRYGHFSREILAAPMGDILAFLRPRVSGSPFYRIKNG